MEVNNGVYESQQRRLDVMERRLQEREEEHQQELANIKQANDERVDDLTRAQSENLTHFTRQKEEDAQEVQKNYLDDLVHVRNNYDEEAHDRAKDYYDRTGRLVRDNTRERDKERDFINRSFEQSAHTRESDRDEYEKRLNEIQKKYQEETKELERYNENKFAIQRQAHGDQLTQTVEEAKNRIDDSIRKKTDEIQQEKLGQELKFKKLVDQTEAEREFLSSSHGLREKQLIDEKSEMQKELTRGAGKTVEDYKDRMSANVAQITNDNNFRQAESDQKHADQIAKIEAIHRNKEQDMRSHFRQTENELSSRLESDRNRDDLKKSLDQRRHQQDLFLNSEQLAANNDISTNTLKSHFQEELQTREEKHQRDIQSRSEVLNKKLMDETQRAIETHDQLRFEKTRDTGELNRLHDQEKFHLVKQYENRQNQLEDLRQRQLKDQSEYFGSKMADTREELDKKLHRFNRDNQAQLNRAQEVYKNRVEELETLFTEQDSAKETSYQGKVTRLSDNYYRTLLTQQQHFEDISHEIKSDTQAELNRLRNDKDYEKKMQMLDLQNRNRAMFTAYERKISQLHDEHNSELDKIKYETDRAVRDATKKTKELIESDRKSHQREIEIKDNQMNEKLRIQRENFEEQLARLKRSNEMVINKKG